MAAEGRAATRPVAHLLLVALLRQPVLSAALGLEPLLSPSPPWAWAAAFELPAGDYVWSIARNRTGDYAHASTRLLVLAAGEASAAGLSDLAGRAEELWPRARSLAPGGDLRLGEVHELGTDTRGWVSHFPLALSAPTPCAVFAEHAPHESGGNEGSSHSLRTARGSGVRPTAEVGFLASSSFAFHPTDEAHEHPEGEEDGHEGCDCEHNHENSSHHNEEGGGGHDHEGGHDEAGHQHEGEAAEAGGASLNFAKAGAMLAIVSSAVLGVSLRLRCPALNSPKMFGYVNVLAAGMFIAMALFHILPETIDHAPAQMKTLLTEEESPVSVMTFVFLGFLLVLFFERVLYDAHGAPDDPDGARDQAVREVMNPRMSFIAKANASGTDMVDSHRRGSRTSGTQGPELQVELAEIVARGSRSSTSGRHSVGHGHGAEEGHSHGGAGAGAPAGTAAILLMVSLSVHSMFEGMVLGTATSAGTVALLAVIVCAHKWAAAFAITNQLVPQDQPHSGFSSLTKALLAIFVLASPVGFTIGWVLESASSAEGNPGLALTVSILNSMAVGTLVYISLVEVVPEEFTGSQNSMSKFAVFVAAAGLVFTLSLLHMAYGHEHGAEEEAGHDHR